MWYIYTTEYYSANKKKGMLSFETRWMKVEKIAAKCSKPGTGRPISLTCEVQKDKHHLISLICRI
jgi:hypothetical protein